MDGLLAGQDRFVANIRAVYGEAGESWLSELPSLLDRLCEEWQVQIRPAFPELSYNFVAPVTRADGTSAVLKAGPPDPERGGEFACLRLWAGEGAVRLLGERPDDGAILLERLRPGDTLAALGDDVRATEVAAGLMNRLWRPPPEGHAFPSLHRWTRSLREVEGREPGPIPLDMLAKALALLDELLATTTREVVLHGDLHHLNILSAEREPWLVIDPKGVVGDPGFEVGAWFYNPLPWLLEQPNGREIARRRLSQFAELLGIDRDRLQAWAFVACMLSTAWTTEGSASDPEAGLACAALVEP